MTGLKLHNWINPYTKEDHKIFEDIYKSEENTLTLEQLEKMNLPEWKELALFGRTSKEWRKSLEN